MDNPEEFVHGSFMKLLKDNFIEWRGSAPYTQEQNGVAESVGKVVADLERASRIGGHMDKRFWEQSAKGSVFCRNHFANSKGQIPMLNLTNDLDLVVRNIVMMRPLGCMCVFLIPKEKRKTLGRVSGGTE